MKVDVRPRRKNSPRPAEKSALGFLQYLRGRRCALYETGTCTAARVEAAHVDYAGDKGLSTKASDRFAIPLCADHHAEQHRIGWKRFEAKYGLNALGAAGTYWRNWHGRPAWEAKHQ